MTRLARQFRYELSVTRDGLCDTKAEAILLELIALICGASGLWLAWTWTGYGSSPSVNTGFLILAFGLAGLAVHLILRVLILLPRLLFLVTLSMLRLLGVAAFSMLVSVIRLVRARRPAREASRRPPGRLARLSASSLIDLAVLLAGKKRLALRDEWRAHLAGEGGHDPITWRSNRAAIGFVGSGIKFRLTDAAELAWRPADAVLGSRTLSNLFVWGPVAVVLVAIVHHDGRFGLVADIQDPAALGAFLYGVIRTGRWWRGVKLPEPKARRARSDGGNG